MSAKGSALLFYPRVSFLLYHFSNYLLFELLYPILLFAIFFHSSLLPFLLYLSSYFSSSFISFDALYYLNIFLPPLYLIHYIFNFLPSFPYLWVTHLLFSQFCKMQILLVVDASISARTFCIFLFTISFISDYLNL